MVVMEAKRDQVVCNPIKVKWKLAMLTHTADGLSVTHDVGKTSGKTCCADLDVWPFRRMPFNECSLVEQKKTTNFVKIDQMMV